MKEEQKSIAEVAYGNIQLNYRRTWPDVPEAYTSFYAAFGDEIIKEYERRQPPLQTEEHWMLLDPKERLKIGDRLEQMGSWVVINERGPVGDFVGGDDACRLVRVPVDGGWVKCGERLPTEEDGSGIGGEVLVCSNEEYFVYPWSNVSEPNFDHWKRISPPPVESKPVVEEMPDCYKAFCDHFDISVINEDHPNWKLWQSAWTAREKSLKEDTK